MSDDKKPWEKPWNPQEIAENASKWSFAADLSLLKYLEVFSEDLLNRAAIIDDNVNTLLSNLSKASISLDIAKNQFLSLSNTQFIESRVYEDDETILSNEEKVTKEEPIKNNTDEFNKNEMKLAALRGIEVIEKYFDKVPVVDSDSEEDNDFTSFVLRPKDPYINRPLPYIIGSEKWHKTLHVGLEDSSSESENEQKTENYSDTDSESDLPITNRSQAKSISGSGSSEADLSNKLDHPVANSTLNDTSKPEDLLRSNEDYNSVSAQGIMSQNSFAEQLAAKLGKVIENDVEEPPVNTKPIKKTDNIYKNFFSDEPPPDDVNDEFSPKSKDQGIFSGGDGLFDDLNDDEPFWGPNVEETPKKAPKASTRPTEDLFGDEAEAEDILTNLKKSVKNSNDSEKLKKELERKLNKKKERSIFDEDFESDEDSLFGNSFTTSKKTTDKLKKSESLFDDDNLQSPVQDKKESTNLFSEDISPEARDNISKDPLGRKAPVGGIKVISAPNLFSGQDVKKMLKTRRQSSSESDRESSVSDEIDRKQNAFENITKGNSKKIEVNSKGIDAKPIQTETKSSNLFGDVDIEDDLFKDDLFSNFSSKKNTSNIFGKSDSLFDDLEESDDDISIPAKNIEDNLKKGKKEFKEDKKIHEKIEDNLKSDENGEKIKKYDEPVLKDRQSSIEEENINKSIRNRNIFSADESDSDDLFSSKHSKIISKNKVIEDISSVKTDSKIVPESNPILSKTTKSKTRKVPSLFDDDEDVEDGLFSSKFLSNTDPVAVARKTRLEQKAPLPRKKNLFEEEVQSTDTIFAGFKSSKNEENIFGEDNLIRSAKVEENILNKVDQSLQSSAKDLTQSSSLNGGKSALFENDDLKKDRPKENIYRKNGKDLLKSVENNKTTLIEDSLFKDELLEDDLFGSENQEIYNGKSKSEGSKSVKEEIGENLVRNGVVNQDIRRKELSVINGKSSKSNTEEIFEDSSKEDKINEENYEYFLKSNIISNKKKDLEDDGCFSENKSVSAEEESQKEVKKVDGIQDVIQDIPSNTDPSLNQRNYKTSTQSNSEKINVEENNEEIEDNSSLIGNLSMKNKFSSTVVDRIPSVNIFDPDPPSDPDDWDDRSEVNIFGDDLYSFDNTENLSENRSSIFDREPPSPLFDESSGIVRDHRDRMDIDVSSFYPYASSSRRFSSDILGEEQSNDSLFPTKNRHSIEPNIPPSISESTEHSASNLEITPSGRIEDIYLESSDQVKPVKSVTFEDATDRKIIDDGCEDLDGTKIEDEVFASKSLEENCEDVDVKKPKPSVLKKPELKKLVVTEERKDKDEESKDTGSPGKLKHNLNINVFALLPGAGKPPKREAPPVPQPPQRSISLDLDQTDGVREKPLPRVFVTPELISTRELKTPEKIQNNLDDVEVLESITKSRARGPVKRRPSTKRGREAIRNSCIDFSFASNPTSEDNETEQKESTEAVTSENKSFKDELQTKLIQNSTSRQAEFSIVEKTPLKITVSQQNIETSEVQTVNNSNLIRNEEILTTKTITSAKSSPTTEDVAKISIEKPKSLEKTDSVTDPKPIKLSPASKINNNDSTNPDRIIKVETRPDYAPRFTETSSSRIRKIDRIQTKSNQIEQEKNSLFENKISTKSHTNTEDKSRTISEASHGLRRTDFFSDLMTNLDEPIKSETSGLFRKTETTSTVSETSSSKTNSNTEDTSKTIGETSRRLRRMDFFNDLISNLDEPIKSETPDLFGKPEGVGTVTKTSSNKSKQIDFLHDLMSDESNFDKNNIEKGDKNQTITTDIKTIKNPELGVETSDKDNTPSIFKTNSEHTFKKRVVTKLPSRKKDLFGDDLDDDDLFSSSKSKKRESTRPNFLSVDAGVGDSDLFDVGRKSSFVKTDNFASPEFIKDNLSEDEENEDIFSEKKLPPKSDILKRSSFVDDEDEEDMLGQASQDKRKENTTTSITTRRLKVSNLKKLENVAVTGDDPLNALEK